jgi:putative cell wall-binding protein
MRKFKKAIASLAIVGMALSAFPYAVFASDAYDARLDGLTAVQTAQAIAKDGWTASKNVVLAPASSYNMVDALAAGPLAAALNAPILLTDGDKLSQEVIDEMTRLGVENVYVTSGKAVIKQAVLDALAGKTVVALGGVDQYETSVNIAKEVIKAGGNASTIFVANGETAKVAQDALSIGAVAAAAKQPILLTKKGELPAVVKDYIASLSVSKSVIVGGTGVVADAVKTALPTAERVFGNDAYDTNLEVLKKFSFNFNRVFVANGETKVDALAGAPLAAKTNSAIVISNGTLKADAKTFLNDKVANSSVVTALGGTAVVSDSLLASVKAPVPATLAVESVSATNPITFMVKFNKPVNEATAENLGNYYLDGTALTANGFVAGDAELQDDKETVKIVMSTTANIAGNKLVNDTAYLFQVKDVQDTDLEALNDTYTQAIVFNDETAPTLGAVSYPTNTTAKVSFSEPMSAIAQADVRVFDDKDVDVTSGTLQLSAAVADGKKDLTIDLTGATKDKTYTVKVYGAKDLANNLAGTQTFTVVKHDVDTTDPVITNIQAISLSKFKVTLSEKFGTAPAVATKYGTIKIDGVNVGDGTLDATVNVAAITGTTLNTDGNELTVTLAADLAPAGVHVVSINNVFDKSGNEQTDAYTKALDFQADTTAPKVLSTEVASVAGIDKLLVKFDDSDIQLGTLAGNALTSVTRVVDSVEYAVADFGAAALYDADGNGKTDTIAITLTGASNGDYTATLAATTVADKSGVNAAASNNSAAKKITFSYNVASGTSKPKVVDGDSDVTTGISGGSFTAQAAGTPNEIVLTFDRDVTTSTALDVNNYLVDGVAVFEKAVFVGDTKTVKLTLKQNAIAVTADYPFTIKNVKGTNGQAMNTVTFTQAFTANVAPTIKTATLDSATQITVVFKQSMTAATLTDNNDFELYIGGVKYTGTLTVAGATDTYTITLGTALSASDISKDITLKVKDTADAKDASAITNAIVTGVSYAVSK